MGDMDKLTALKGRSLRICSRGSLFYRCVFVIAFLLLTYSCWEKSTSPAPAENTRLETISEQSLKTTQIAERSDDKQNISSESFATSRRKLILLWNIAPDITHPSVIDARCGECDVTKDHTLLAQSDAVVILYRDMRRLPDPKVRKPHQRFVWLCRESPSTTILRGLNLSRFDNYFNATMTYRRDSDIFMPYIRRLTPEGISPFLLPDQDKILSSKRHLVAWVVSNCGATPSAIIRINYVKRLIRAGIDVHRFGGCYNSTFPPYRSLEANHKLNKYKFYLAMENSFDCRDYITEKFWSNGILSGTVPIVWGAHPDDVAAMAPPGSYLVAPENPQDLAEKLTELDRDDHAYLTFFDWRKNLDLSSENAGFKFRSADERLAGSNEPSNWMVDSMNSFGYCELCRSLSSDTSSNKTIASLNDWWYGKERGKCLPSKKDPGLESKRV